MNCEPSTKLEKLNDALAAGSIKAITPDTSVFDRNAFRLEGGLLRKLSQFSENNVALILSDVVEREIVKHITANTAKVRQEVERSLAKLAKSLPTEKSIIDAFRSSILNQKDPHTHALERFDSFKNETGLEVVCTNEYVSVEKLMHAYFSCMSPFAAAGKKKQEFHDAVTLFAIEAWARSNNGIVLAVSIDRDWELFCHQSEHIEYLEDLSTALALFQIQDASQACIHLYQRIQRGELTQIDRCIEHAVSDELEATDLSPTAASNFRYEYDSSSFWVGSIKLEMPEDGATPFKPVQFDENEVTVEALATASVAVDFGFSFFTYDSIDRDEILLGSGSSRVERPLSFRVLITLVGNLSNLGGIIEIEDAEATLVGNPVFDCGEIEPDWLQEER